MRHRIGGNVENIELLRQLTETLPDWVVPGSRVEGRIEYELEGGRGYGLGLYRVANLVSVMQLYLPEGVRFPPHQHAANEWGIVYNGSIEVSFYGVSTLVRTGEYIHFPAGIKHEGIALEDCHMIVVGVPELEGFPDTR